MSAVSALRGFARRTLALARAEVLHVIRDRASLVQIIVMPLISCSCCSNVATVRREALAGLFRRLRTIPATSAGKSSRVSRPRSVDIVGEVGVAGRGQRSDAARRRDGSSYDPARTSSAR
jgi:hypothetical protein